MFKNYTFRETDYVFLIFAIQDVSFYHVINEQNYIY